MNRNKDRENENKSERKRKREQQRRTEVSRGLDSLAELVFRIEPSLKAHSVSNPRGALTVTNRVELINSAVQILERLHRENEERKTIIGDLMEERRAKRAKQEQNDTNKTSTEQDDYEETRQKSTFSKSSEMLSPLPQKIQKKIADLEDFSKAASQVQRAPKVPEVKPEIQKPADPRQAQIARSHAETQGIRVIDNTCVSAPSAVIGQQQNSTALAAQQFAQVAALERLALQNRIANAELLGLSSFANPLGNLTSLAALTGMTGLSTGTPALPPTPGLQVVQTLNPLFLGGGAIAPEQLGTLSVDIQTSSGGASVSTVNQHGITGMGASSRPNQI